MGSLDVDVPEPSDVIPYWFCDDRQSRHARQKVDPLELPVRHNFSKLPRRMRGASTACPALSEQHLIQRKGARNCLSIRATE